MNLFVLKTWLQTKLARDGLRVHHRSRQVRRHQRA